MKKEAVKRQEEMSYFGYHGEDDLQSDRNRIPVLAVHVSEEYQGSERVIVSHMPARDNKFYYVTKELANEHLPGVVYVRIHLDKTLSFYRNKKDMVDNKKPLYHFTNDSERVPHAIHEEELKYMQICQ